MITITIDEQQSHLKRLEEMYELRSSLQKQIGRKPTFTEWAQAAECSMEALLHDFRLGLHARKQLRGISPLSAHPRSKSLLERVNKAYLVLSIINREPPTLTKIADYLGLEPEQLFGDLQKADHLLIS